MAHTTNYIDTFITVAPDSDVTAARVPPERKTPTAAQRILEWARDEPYRYTSDDLLFRVQAEKQGLSEAERDEARRAFFAQPKACLRANALPKTHGWGVHHDSRGRVAMFAVESPEYAKLARGEGPDGPVKVVAAMRSRRR